MLGRLLRFSLIAGVVFGAESSALATLTPSDIYKKVANSVARLSVQTPSGKTYVASAFLAFDDSTAITAWHAVHDAESVTATFLNGETYPVLGLIDYNEQADLALVRLPSTKLQPAELTDQIPSIGSWIYAIGAPRGYGGSIVEGLLSGLRDIDGIRQFQVSCPFSPGNSGGPIVDGLGRVLGVASWSKRNAQNLNFAVPSVFVKDLNRSEAFVPWPASMRKEESDPGESESVVAEEDATPRDLESFKRAFKSLSGQTIILTLSAGKREETFSFDVP